MPTMVFIRDRTNLFVSYRQSFTRDPFSTPFDNAASERLNEPLMNGDDEDEAIEMEEMPPQWLDITNQLDKVINQIQHQIAQLQPLYKQNSLPGFDDRSQVDKQIEQLRVSTTRAIRECQALVKSFSSVANKQLDPNLHKLALNIESAMAAKVQDCSTRFRQMQSSYLKTLQKDQLGDLPGILQGPQVDHTVEDDVALSQMALQQSQSQHGAYEDAEVARREEGINRAADTILELADIFRDLQTMVIDQGSLIDRIDYNIDATLTHVKNADKQLVQGERYQKRSQKCYVILLLVLIVIGLVLVLLFRPHHRTRVVHDTVVEKGGSSESGSEGDK